MKVIVTQHDPYIYYIRGRAEAIEDFGEDYLNDYGVELPDDLIERYKKAYAAFWEVQNEIDKIKENSNETGENQCRA